MSLENQFAGWTGPSSDTEQEKQERTERMIREAIAAHAPLNSCSLEIFAKGSYANNTNVRSDSDVDVAVKCTDALYWEEEKEGLHLPSGVYQGIWTPDKLRMELVAALKATFKNQVDNTGTTAIKIHSGSARVDADVVPCFSFRRYMVGGTVRDGTKIFKTDGKRVVNYPAQQLENGQAKNKRTGYAFKKGARLLKRIENAMAAEQAFKELPSYFMECLAYNCPDAVFTNLTWTDTLRAMLMHIWNGLQGDEPSEASDRWVEVNECFYLFHPAQKWTREDGREFAKAAWNWFRFN
ncbi:MAG: nucleotidyltransferase [Gammaproteobacteria bacterium]|nr:nucleotidyltransferase [Gammaproteobacteria bacterium]